MIAAAPDVEPVVLSTIFDWRPALSGGEAAADPVSLSATDLRHPIFRPFGALAANLGQVRFEHAWRVRADGWDVAARFTDGTPALLERREGKGRVVLFASDLDRRWNDFPLHPAFVPFAVEAVRYVSAAPDRAREYVGRARARGRASRGPASTGRSPAIARSPSTSIRARARSARVTPDEFDGMLDRVSTDRAARTGRAGAAGRGAPALLAVRTAADARRRSSPNRSSGGRR